MTAARFHLSREQVFSNAGAPLSGAKLFFYVTGTTTLLATYSNAQLAAANANPVVADSSGRFGDIFLQDQTYRVIMRDSTEATTFFDTDPVYKDVTFIRSAGLPAVSFPNMIVHNTSDGKKYRRNSAGSAWIDEGPVDSVGNGASVADVVTGTSTSLFATPDAVAGLWERGTDIASASTLTIPVAGGGYFEVTGTTTINGINSQRSGLEIELRFTDVLTLTRSGTFAMIGGASIVTEAGDIARFRNVSAIGTSGTSWRMVSYERATGKPLYSPASSAKTTTYNVADTDRGDLIRFSGLSGDATLALPAAAGRAGFLLYVRNDDATHGVVVNPSGAELIDGVPTRRTNGPNTITILCDGTGWRTISGSYLFRSTGQTVAALGLNTVAHGLGLQPRRVWYYYVCVSSSAGFTAGEEVFLVDTDAGGGPVYGYSFYSDTTNINARAGSGATIFTLVNKGTGAHVSISAGALANWGLVICADAP